jgi:hypothetical protein
MTNTKGANFMARIEGITKGGSLLARFAFFVSRRRFGRVTKPMHILALHNTLLMGTAAMQIAQDKANQVPLTLKKLAIVLIALRGYSLSW